MACAHGVCQNAGPRGSDHFIPGLSGARFRGRIGVLVVARLSPRCAGRHALLYREQPLHRDAAGSYSNAPALGSLAGCNGLFYRDLRDRRRRGFAIAGSVSRSGDLPDRLFPGHSAGKYPCRPGRCYVARQSRNAACAQNPDAATVYRLGRVVDADLIVGHGDATRPASTSLDRYRARCGFPGNSSPPNRRAGCRFGEFASINDKTRRNSWHHPTRARRWGKNMTIDTRKHCVQFRRRRTGHVLRRDDL